MPLVIEFIFSYEASNAFSSSTVSPAAASFSAGVGGVTTGGAGAGSGVLPAASHC